MTFRQVIRPGDQGDVPPHEHDATDISGTFNFIRVLQLLATGDVTTSGFLRTGTSGPRIEIRPDSGVGGVPSIQWFDADGQTGFIEMEDQGSDTWALKIAGPADSGSGSAIIKLREDGILVLDSDDASGFIEAFKYFKANAPIRLAAGSAGAPSLTFQSQQNKGIFDSATDEFALVIDGAQLLRLTDGQLLMQDGTEAAPILSRISGTSDGFFFGSGFLAAAIGGSEVARFTAEGLRGLEVQHDENDNSRTFTNTGYLDLDALTGGSGTIAAVATTVETGTRALVIIGCSNILNSGGTTLVSYKVSGDSTIDASDQQTLRNGGSQNMGASQVLYTDGLTPGTNTFEAQARVSAGTGTLDDVKLTVIPL